MHVRGTQITATVFLKVISEVGISQGCKKKTRELPPKMAPGKFGAGIRRQRTGSYKGPLPRAEKENDKGVASFKSPATLHI